MSLAGQQKPIDQITDFNTGQPHGIEYDTPPSTDDGTKRSPRDTGTLVIDDETTRYIDSANWRAILEEVPFITVALETRLERDC